MNLSYLIVMTRGEMIDSNAVAVEFGQRAFGSFAFIIPLGVALATFGCALSIQFSVTRLCFVAGREGHFLEPMSYIHHERMTPGPAVALQVGFHILSIQICMIQYKLLICRSRD